MELAGRPDFDRVLQRFEAWWHGAIIDRPLITINVRPPHPLAPLPSAHATLRQRWLDVEYNVACVEATVRDAVYVADAFPTFMPNLGPDICAAAFGCPLVFGEDTSWSKPIASSCADILHMTPDLDGEYWRTIRQMTDLSLERGQGRWLTGLTDLHTNGDLVAALRGPQALCRDFVRDPDGVRAACEHVTRFYAAMYDDLWQRIASRGLPATTWLAAPHAGTMYVPNCDFICMISPPMFQRAILPSILAEMEMLERTIFHLDGPTALQHLDAVLGMEQLNGLQWVWGAGNGPAARWGHVYQRAQAAGKSVQVLCQDTRDALATAEQLRPEGVWLCPDGQYTTDEALAFVRDVERWAAKATRLR